MSVSIQRQIRALELSIEKLETVYDLLWDSEFRSEARTVEQTIETLTAELAELQVELATMEQR